MRAVSVLKTAIVILAQLSLVTLAAVDDPRVVEKAVFGKGYTYCEEDLPTLSVARENLINTKEEWDEFRSKNEFFVVAAADSSCAKCCDSEPLLNDLLSFIKDKAVFSYPEKNKKQKKIVRREI